MGQALGIVYHTLATHLLKKVGFSCKTAQTGAVTLIQRFGSALNLNIHSHMLFLDGVYVERSDGSVRVRRVKVPKIAEVTHLTHTLAHRIGRFLEQQGLLERDADDCMDAGGSATQRAVAENSYLAGDDEEAGPMDQLLGHSITYRIAVVKAALLLNSAAVIFAHNHPSGVPEPSRADLTLTKRLQDALALVDIRIRVLDHIIVWGVGTVSLAERGL